jgi:L-ascorbate metabolism protein UlaG (beta-lactamase superfamily)
MRLTKYTHACVRVEKEGAVLVIDPGTFSERAALDGADAVLITHEHMDHLDRDALVEALGKRPSMSVFTNEAVAGTLTDLGGEVTAVRPGEAFTAAGFSVRAYGGQHALIHTDIPRVTNLGFLVDERVYHPGDSFEVPGDATVETLFVPVSAPWLKIAEAIDFVRAVRPARAFALHEGLLNDIGLGLVDRLIGGYGGTEYARLAAGQSVDA